jgi:hypothetical protein
VTWRPGPRAEWVAAVNRGDVWPLAEVAAVPFTLERLAGDAASRLGRSGADVVATLGDDSVEALGVLLPALEDEANLTVLGRWITHRFLARLVEQRLALEAYTASDPEVRGEEIVAPWFVVGAPRTGTTVLFGLLATDDRLRAPEGWELLRPVPPPARDPDPSARIALAGTELQTPQVVADGLVAIHEYSARMPKECLSAMSLAFRSEEFVARYDVPTYTEWLHRGDPLPAYEMHRRVLQVLQRGAPTRRWLLKSPVHLQALPTLLHVYPDARLSTTHRDPVAFLASVSSLVATMRSVHSDVVDPVAIGRYHVDLYARSLDRLVDLVDDGTLAADRCTHSRHRDFVDDALAVASGIYAHFGWDLPAPTRAAMVAYLDGQGTDTGAVHHSTATDFGIDPVEVDDRFARVAARFLSAPAGPTGADRS